MTTAYFHNTSFGDGEQVYNKQGRSVGKIIDGVLYKTARDKHMLRKPAGWAWDKSILEQAKRDGVKSVAVKNMDSGITFMTDIEEFWKDGVEINRGFGEQVVLPIKYWQQYSDRNAAQPNLI